ncbi:acyl-CoA thioesterase [Parendozoicomonas haliclonae]|uniref:1,4-dihydroxy-2-naphthoyl-CoA hydrolase n=1 Tax=Parendozoicomonas haliclonae TaxID=1960125 RepID=A0A1X7ARB7_9GAMM|nr:thioesterase family protein [Parendozoicomonas haliclonae]SMA49947.1 1,4-dihydroxy-2-naphthoyl-CoA hydrolase [Parendozoicomonas haliclonae]
MADPVQCPSEKRHYKYFFSSRTRWDDNDHYGHMNNSKYYAYFDDAIGHFLMRECGLQPLSDESVFYVVHSQCNYLNSVSYPDEVEVGLVINRIGSSSVQYGLALFKAGAEQASATGTFTHVYVNKSTNKSAPVPEHFRKIMMSLAQ